MSPWNRSVPGAVVLPHGYDSDLQLYGCPQGTEVPQKCVAPLKLTGTQKLWGWGCPKGLGCSRGRESPEGTRGCRLPPKAIGVLRGLGLPQDYGGARGGPLSLWGWCGGTASPGGAHWLVTARHSQGGRDTGLCSGGSPAAPCKRSKPAPQCPCAPSKPRHQPPLYRWGN